MHMLHNNEQVAAALVVLDIKEVEIQNRNTSFLYLSSFFGYLYFTISISVDFYLSTFSKENGYFCSDTFPVSILVTHY